jgi:hypothetical protein
MMTKSSLGPDPSQWSNSKMTGVGMSIAGTVAGMMTSALVAAATGGGRPGRGYSAKQARLSAEKIHELELHLSSLLLQRRIGQLAERDRENAELSEALAYERYMRARGL